MHVQLGGFGGLDFDGGGGGGSVVTPGAPTNSVQFNNAGAFGGDANLIWDAAHDSLVLEAGQLIIGNTFASVGTTFPGAALFGNATYDPTFGDPIFQFEHRFTSDPPYAAMEVSSRIDTGANVGEVAALYAVATGFGSHSYSSLYGSAMRGQVRETATAANLWGMFSSFSVIETATATRGVGVYVDTPFLDVGATLGTSFAYWSSAFAGKGANAYNFWADEQGVFRIKADNTFDSVYQCIAALYNPQVTKYTPGAANYERIVFGQWNANVAEYGTEKGGTGTLRKLRLLGAGILTSATILPTSDPHVAGQLWNNSAVVTVSAG